MNFNLSTGIVHVHAIFRLRLSISESHCVIRSVIARAMTVIKLIQKAYQSGVIIFDYSDLPRHVLHYLTGVHAVQAQHY